jgi:protein-tyrosine phosphatase
MSTGEIPPARGNDHYRVCFVCTGNICRSPMAEMVLRHLAQNSPLGTVLEISSAGTGPWHEGEPMDPRARRALESAGYVDLGHVAHQFDITQFDVVDLLVALDRRHRQTLKSLSIDPVDNRLVLLRSFDHAAGGAVDIPDPYYGDEADFDRCLSMVESGCRGLFDRLTAALGEPAIAGQDHGEERSD